MMANEGKMVAIQHVRGENSEGQSVRGDRPVLEKSSSGMAWQPGLLALWATRGPGPAQRVREERLEGLRRLNGGGGAEEGRRGGVYGEH